MVQQAQESAGFDFSDVSAHADVINVIAPLPKDENEQKSQMLLHDIGCDIVSEFDTSCSGRYILSLSLDILSIISITCKYKSKIEWVIHEKHLLRANIFSV